MSTQSLGPPEKDETGWVKPEPERERAGLKVLCCFDCFIAITYSIPNSITKPIRVRNQNTIWSPCTYVTLRLTNPSPPLSLSQRFFLFFLFQFVIDCKWVFRVLLLLLSGHVFSPSLRLPLSPTYILLQLLLLFFYCWFKASIF